MTTTQALEWVKSNWQELPHNHLDYDKETPMAVWFVTDDMADSYEVDEEHIGMKEDGTLVWAYASGCSCWDGDYSIKDIGCDTESVKVFEFDHENMPEKFDKQLLEFVDKYKTLN